VTRRQKRKIIIIAILAILLLLLALYFLYFRATKRLDFGDLGVSTQDLLPTPEYLYSFSGPDDRRLERPIGVYVDDEDGEVYVSDTRYSKVFVFNLDGDLLREIGGEEMRTPLYIAENPVDGNIYVSDRRARTINIYTPEGEFVGIFDPQLPEEELPTFETGGVQWAPVALGFAEDGSLYVSEILKGHRILQFAPDGSFVKSAGTAGIVLDSTAAPQVFQFPNSVHVQDENVWVADSNNRRMQIFDTELEFDSLLSTGGLPRGFDFLADTNPSDETTVPPRFVIVDTLAHDCTIWNADSGEKVLSFGERGVLEGQFSYPNDLSIGPNNLIFITDSANGRIQVWGWPAEISPIPLPEVAQYWRWCFAPLLLLPLLLLLRKKRFLATKDFVDVMLAEGLVHHMPARRRKWLVTERDYELLKDFVQGDVNLGELLQPTEFSESDVNSLMERMEIGREEAIVVSVAQRSHVFCTEDAELRRIARTLEIDVVNHQEFMERFANKDAEETAGPTGGEGEGS